MNTKRRVKRMVFRQLDLIYNSAVKISKDWGNDGIPLAILDKVLKYARLKNSSGDVTLQEFYNQYNGILIKIGTNCHNMAKKLQSDSVSMDYLRQQLDTVKKGFEKGLK